MDYDLIVVGEGISGLTCAGEAARLGLAVASFEAEFSGGLIVNVNELERFDEAAGLSGMEHAATLAQRNRKAGVVSHSTTVVAVYPAGEGFCVESTRGAYTARAVVLASGARVKKLGVDGEEQFDGRGVSHCADCDAPMFEGTEVVVAGGGDWAIHEALVLARECSTVHVLHETARPTACSEYLERARAEAGIRFWPEARIEQILGDSAVKGVRIRQGDGAIRELPCAGVFALTGLEPNGAIAPAAVLRDDAGFLRVDDELQTAVPRIWAIGQVRSGFGGWLSDAAQEGRRAAKAVRACLS